MVAFLTKPPHRRGLIYKSAGCAEKNEGVEWPISGESSRSGGILNAAVPEIERLYFLFVLRALRVLGGEHLTSSALSQSRCSQYRLNSYGPG